MTAAALPSYPSLPRLAGHLSVSEEARSRSLSPGAGGGTTQKNLIPECTARTQHGRRGVVGGNPAGV